MKLIIELKSDLSIAKEMLTKTQLFFYTVKHIMIKEPIFNAIKIRLSRSYTIEKEKEGITMILDSTEEQCKKEKKELESFMFSDEKTLKKTDFYKEVNKSRNIKRYARKIRQTMREKKAQLTRKLIGGNNIIGWFNSVGIFITWRLE